MKNISILFTIFLLAGLTAFAQDEATESKKENKNKSLLGNFMAHESRPVSEIYNGNAVIENQTALISPAKSLEVVFQHRFGDMTNGISDIWGIYGAANIRMAASYSITDWLQVGFGTTKQNKLQDFGLKINLLQQSRDNKIPVSVTYYGNLAIDARDEKFYGINYEFSDRISYFNELLVTRKVADWFTASVGGSFTHFNQVDSLMEHDKIALHFLGRFKFSPQSSIIVNFDLPLKIDGMKEWAEFTNPPKYNFGIGYEVATATHVFQVFAGSATYLVPQYNVMYNQYEFFKGTKNIFIGFNIARVWSF